MYNATPLAAIKGGANASPYAAWGNQAETARTQGWYPETNFNGETTYRSKYGNAFNGVIIPTEKEPGHIALIGHQNQKFDVVIRNSKGNIVDYIHKAISPDEVQQYITNSNSNVAKRNMSIIKGTNPDRAINGSYASLGR